MGRYDGEDDMGSHDSKCPEMYRWIDEAIQYQKISGDMEVKWGIEIKIYFRRYGFNSALFSFYH